MPNRYPAEQRERATRMALDRLDEYGSAWKVAQALGPKLGVGPETLRKWVVRAQTDAGSRPGPTSDEGTAAQSGDSSVGPLAVSLAHPKLGVVVRGGVVSGPGSLVFDDDVASGVVALRPG